MLCFPTSSLYMNNMILIAITRSMSCYLRGRVWDQLHQILLAVGLYFASGCHYNTLRLDMNMLDLLIVSSNQARHECTDNSDGKKFCFASLQTEE